jgi:hypothetical protein
MAEWADFAQRSDEANRTLCIEEIWMQLELRECKNNKRNSTLARRLQSHPALHLT